MNNNSSRFGKLIEIMLSPTGEITGGNFCFDEYLQNEFIHQIWLKNTLILLVVIHKITDCQNLILS